MCVRVLSSLSGFDFSVKNAMALNEEWPYELLYKNIRCSNSRFIRLDYNTLYDATYDSTFLAYKFVY